MTRLAGIYSCVKHSVVGVYWTVACYYASFLAVTSENLLLYFIYLFFLYSFMQSCFPPEMSASAVFIMDNFDILEAAKHWRVWTCLESITSSLTSLTVRFGSLHRNEFSSIIWVSTKHTQQPNSSFFFLNLFVP